MTAAQGTLKTEHTPATMRQDRSGRGFFTGFLTAPRGKEAINRGNWRKLAHCRLTAPASSAGNPIHVAPAGIFLKATELPPRRAPSPIET